MRLLRREHFYPLLGFIVPTAVTAYIFVIPGTCIAGFNSLTLGFASTLLGASATYVHGVRSALRSHERGSRAPS